MRCIDTQIQIITKTVLLTETVTGTITGKTLCIRVSNAVGPRLVEDFLTRPLPNPGLNFMSCGRPQWRWAEVESVLWPPALGRSSRAHIRYSIATPHILFHETYRAYHITSTTHIVVLTGFRNAATVVFPVSRDWVSREGERVTDATSDVVAVPLCDRQWSGCSSSYGQQHQQSRFKDGEGDSSGLMVIPAAACAAVATKVRALELMAYLRHAAPVSVTCRQKCDI